MEFRLQETAVFAMKFSRYVEGKHNKSANSISTLKNTLDKLSQRPLERLRPLILFEVELYLREIAVLAVKFCKYG